MLEGLPQRRRQVPEVTLWQWFGSYRTIAKMCLDSSPCASRRAEVVQERSVASRIAARPERNGASTEFGAEAREARAGL